MPFITHRLLPLTRLPLLVALVTFWPYLLGAQPSWPGFSSTTPSAQRNALNAVQSHVRWLQNSTHTASGYGRGGYDLVWRQFQSLRGSFQEFVRTLRPDQLSNGANDLADLAGGLDILQEAFSNFQNDVAGGLSERWALQNMCRVLDRAAVVWMQELNRDSNRLRVGW